jgi:ParB family chromosome partitioning protein
MSRKRRIFDLDLPEEPEAGPPDLSETFPAGKVAAEAVSSPATSRRGPMATAVQENAEALRTRSAAEAAIRAENDALALELVRLKSLGLIVDLIPVDLIDVAKLVRDRSSAPDMEMAELKASIRDIGLSNPIRVEPKSGGRFELVQGMRRLTAYRELLAETHDARFERIPAGLVTDAGGLEGLYRRMVDENLVRKDISFAEMAQLARAYAADPNVDCNDADKAVAILYQSAGYQKRSYIRAFAELLDRLGDALIYPQEIPRNLGLALRKRLESEPEIAARIGQDLDDWDSRTVQDELDVLRRWAGVGQGEDTFPAGKVSDAPAGAPRKPRVTFELPRAEGAAKCTAANGRLEVRLGLDFSRVDRRKLEAAVRAMLDQLK